MYDHDTDPISARLRAEEERLRRRVILMTLVPVAAAVLLIALTSRQVSNARDELIVLRDSAVELGQEIGHRLEALETARRQADSLNAQVNALETWVDRRSAGAADSIQVAAAEEFRAMTVKPRVYLHIVDERQRRPAAAVQSRLEQAGYVVPGIERVASGPSGSEIRYFRSDERTGAEEIQRLLEAGGVRIAVTDLSRRFGSSSTIRALQYEIWFGPDFASPQDP